LAERDELFCSWTTVPGNSQRMDLAIKLQMKDQADLKVDMLMATIRVGLFHAVMVLRVDTEMPC